MHTLTPRQTEILPYLINGDYDKHIARQLGISNRTVQFHVKCLLHKFGLKNRVQAAVWADRRLRATVEASA
jgi:two-component system nitrate/nitrite response regulator NarL